MGFIPVPLGSLSSAQRSASLLVFVWVFSVAGFIPIRPYGSFEFALRCAKGLVVLIWVRVGTLGRA